MSVENRKLTGRVPGLLILGLLAASAGHSLAAANIPGHGDSGMPVDRHGRSSPAPGGGWVHTLPPGHRLYHHRGRRFYFYDGFWYERGRGGYFVVRPPIGLHVPAPPPIIVAPRPASPVLPPQDSARPPFVYPRNGQSAEVQANATPGQRVKQVSIPRRSAEPCPRRNIPSAATNTNAP